MVLISTTFNSRDVGGLPARCGSVRRGLLIRSDAPIDADDRALNTLRELGIRTAIDLREPVERELDPAPLSEILVKHVPILGGEFDVNTGMSLEEIYFALLERRGRAFAAAVGALSEPDALPALVFCSAGKDRTGLVVALTLAVLGVSDEEIVADYVLSERAMADGFRSVIQTRTLAAGISEREIAVKVGAPTGLMRGVLAWLRERHGGAAGYLRTHGLHPLELERLRWALVEPGATSTA